MDKIKFLTECITQEIISFIVDDKDIDYDKAIDCFYSSQTFEKLNDPATGLYLESSAYVYEIFKSELANGAIVQEEQ